MACDVIDGIDKDGRRVTIHLCSRGVRVSKCQVAGCTNKHTKLCDFPLAGAAKGRTCDRKLCDAHAHKQQEIARLEGGLRTTDTLDYCPAHHELVKQGVTTKR